MNFFAVVATYLTQALLGLILFAFILRFWMQWLRVDFRNDIGGIVINITNPTVIPIRRVLPSIGSIDTATVVLAVLVAVAKLLLLGLINGQEFPLAGMLLYAIVDVLRYSLYLFFGAIFVMIIGSWFAPHSHNPVFRIAGALAYPLMAPVRRLIPPLGGLDISPIFVILLLNVSLMFLDFYCRNPYQCFF